MEHAEDDKEAKKKDRKGEKEKDENVTEYWANHYSGFCI
jgi:hypothetical protein